jgi:hypothetical protein
MKQIKLSGPVTAIILALVLLVVFLIGQRVINPPQKLGPEAQAMRDAYLRAQQGGQR